MSSNRRLQRRPRHREAPASSARTSASGLLDEGCEVIAIDNLLTGRIENIEPLLGHPTASRSSTTT